jgi:hypothetical protein
MLMDFFRNSPFRVELEIDLSLKKQLLDVVILRREEGPFLGLLPDGLEDLAAHNLITFKSYQEALDDWALKELTGHYVNYRKQVCLPTGELLSEGEFRLYAVCARYPQHLAGQTPLVKQQQGVYDCRRGTDLIRVVVLGQLPQSTHNAMLHLFSASQDQVCYGAEHYRQRSEETSTLLQRLLNQYRKEGVAMSYTMEDFRRDYVKEHLKDLTPEERLAGLTPEERLAGLTPEAKEALRKLLQGEVPPSSSA